MYVSRVDIVPATSLAFALPARNLKCVLRLLYLILTLSIGQTRHYHPVVISLLRQQTQLGSKDYHRGNHHNDPVSERMSWMFVFRCANNLEKHVKEKENIKKY